MILIIQIKNEHMLRILLMKNEAEVKPVEK